ncbi:NAD(P) transhydrogenase subunit alpha [Ignatzschineria rhizosphaerae]|uniref:proton-translocating NAD(P)(+) transhydrogenase n=1 Tax=Ignatzschineria rhizosphaerae TaxID=2923279 RepID=A0ABY3WXY0_9GAMM|nr:NAD(P) transhydrogenase subunit alpha [Ignatzschineria rhizosphaerae]UNM95469.1 NAD(P) transhydrogenase subunit alpha [Ignatzschineria rhizosphaerae]
MITGFAALYIVVLSAILGFEVISRVPAILHTPLMSGSNFIHGIILVGAMIALGHADGFFQTSLAFIAVVFGAVNAVGGYYVTDRMLEMFKSNKKEEK